MKATYINHYLADTDVANFARQSFGKLAEQYTKEQNDNLVRFLARGVMGADWRVLIDKMLSITDEQEAHELAVYLRSIPEHWVPFGHPQITLRMQAPVPITVQCYKHKIGFVESGESRRYIKSTPELFIPDEFRLIPANVKQGSAGVHPYSDRWKRYYTEKCREMIALYEDMIADGIAPEQARFVLPQGVELNWVWTGSLYAYANATIQRRDDHAQKEIRDLFVEIDDIISPLYPVAWAALTKGQY